MAEDRWQIMNNRRRAQAIERGVPIDEVTGTILDDCEPAEIFADAADVMGNFRDIAVAMLEYSEGDTNRGDLLDTVLNQADKLKVSSVDSESSESELSVLLFSGFDEVIKGWSDQAERYRNQG